MWDIASHLIAQSGSGLIQEGAASARATMFTTSEFGWKKSPLKTTAALSGLAIASEIAKKNKDIAAIAFLVSPALIYGISAKTNKEMNKEITKKSNTPLKQAMTMFKKHRIPIAFGAALGIIGYNLLMPRNKNKKKEK